jgi:hypothetical protein
MHCLRADLQILGLDLSPMKQNMSAPREADDVKLVSSLFSSQEPLLEQVIRELQASFGPVDWTSPTLCFDRTSYYEREMGWPLYRRFVSFRRLIRPEEIVQVKLMCNQTEKKYSAAGKRQINIDPGYISLERLILTTGKNYTHRIYLSKGIYADLTLVFRKGSFESVQWTYPDYADPMVIGYFNEVRARYKTQLRGEQTGPDGADQRETEQG